MAPWRPAPRHPLLSIRDRIAVPDGRRALYGAAVEHGVLGVVPVVGTAALFRVFANGGLAVDFQTSYWPAGQRILHGLSPYIDPAMLNIARPGGFAYPAVGALVLAPFALLSRGWGEVIFTALNLASVPGALWILGVRDWRPYGLVLLWLPVISGWEVANLTLPLALGMAAVWRHRNRPLIAGFSVALLVSIKPFVWPLGLFLLATRRYSAAAYTVASGLILNAIAWSVIGFDEIRRFSRLLHALTRAADRIGYSVIGFALHLGAARQAAYAVGMTLAAGVAILCIRAGRVRRERLAFVLCIGVTLLATPIIWLHYFALLIVPLALTSPRLGPIWAVPMVMWVCLPVNTPESWQVAVALAATTAVFAFIVRAAIAEDAEPPLPLA